MFKFIRRLIYFLIILVILLVLSHNMVAGWVIQGGVARLTGFKAFIGSVNLPFTRATVQLRDIAIRNPPDLFHDHRAMEINRIEGDYDLFALFKGRLHLSKLTLDIPQVVAVRNASGETNLKMMETGGSKPKPSSASEKDSKFQIDELTLSMGEALYVDEKAGTTQPRVFKLNIQNRNFRNIKSSEDIKRIVMTLLMEKVSSNLLGIAPNLLKQAPGSATNLFEKGKNLLKGFNF